MSNQPLKTKNPKRIFYVLKDIYLYIIGANLALVFLNGIISEFFDFKKSIIINIPLALTFALISLVITYVIMWWAIKWGVESALRKNKVYSNEYFKISVIIGAIPVCLIFIYVLLRIPSVRRYAEIVAAIPSLHVLFFTLKELILGFISGLVYGIATYFWFKKLSK